MKRKQKAEAKNSRSRRRQWEERTTWVKWGVVVGLNIISLIVAWLVAGRPAPDLLPMVSWYAALFCPGRLHPPCNEFLVFLARFLNLQVFRYLLIVNGLACIPLLFGAEFIKRLYQFDDLNLALEYLIEESFTPAFYSHDTKKTRGDSSYDGTEGTRRRFATIKDGKLIPFRNRPRNRTIAWAGGPGKVIVPSEYAIVLERGGRLVAVRGPGIVPLWRFEKVYKVIDLRHIVRKTTHEALTRDGIPVKMELKLRFHIQPPEHPSKEDKENPYPFDKKAVGKLATSLPARKKESGAVEVVEWKERPLMMVGSAVNEIIARYRVDELFEPLNDALEPRLSIQNEVWRLIHQRTLGSGLDVTEVWLGEFQLPDEVTEQYIKYWQADWRREDKVKLAKGEASAIRELGAARAEAQQLTIETLVAAFQSAQAADLDIAPKQLVALRLIDGLEHLYRQAGHAAGRSRQLTLERQLEQLRLTVRPPAQQPKEG